MNVFPYHDPLLYAKDSRVENRGVFYHSVKYMGYVTMLLVVNSFGGVYLFDRYWFLKYGLGTGELS